MCPYTGHLKPCQAPGYWVQEALSWPSLPALPALARLPYNHRTPTPCPSPASFSWQTCVQRRTLYCPHITPDSIPPLPPQHKEPWGRCWQGPKTGQKMVFNQSINYWLVTSEWKIENAYIKTDKCELGYSSCICQKSVVLEYILKERIIKDINVMGNEINGSWVYPLQTNLLSFFDRTADF